MNSEIVNTMTESSKCKLYFAWTCKEEAKRRNFPRSAWCSVCDGCGKEHTIECIEGTK